MLGCAPTRSGLAAIAALVTVIASPRGAIASEDGRRAVAVLNVAADQIAGADLAAELRGALTSSRVLRPVPDGPLAAALADAVDPAGDAAERRGQAVALLQTARKAIDQFEDQAALGALDQAEALLLHIAPAPGQTVTPDAVLLAAVNVHRAEILVRNLPASADALARTLRIARRLDPRRTLDPAVYRPEVIATWAAVAAPVPRSARLSLPAPDPGARVHVDGAQIAAPAGRTAASTTGCEAEPGDPADSAGTLTYSVEPGIHYIQLVRPGHAVAGRRVELSAGAELQVVLPASPLSPVAFARAARAEVIGTPPAPASSALCRAVHALSRSAGAAAVAVIAGTRDDLWVGLYDGDTRRFSEWRSARGARAADLLAPLERPVWTVPDPSLPHQVFVAALRLVPRATARADAAGGHGGAVGSVAGGVTGPRRGSGRGVAFSEQTSPGGVTWRVWVPVAALTAVTGIVSVFLFRRDEPAVVSGTCCDGVGP